MKGNTKMKIIKNIEIIRMGKQNKKIEKKRKIFNNIPQFPESCPLYTKKTKNKNKNENKILK